MQSLGSSAGKMMAHSGHAANAFIHEACIYPLLKHQDIDPLVNVWKDSTPQGFGTQINLKASWELALAARTAVINLSRDPDRWSPRWSPMSNLVVDPTYPYEVNDEIFGLISDTIHTDTPIKMANGNWLCFRHEITAIYYFGLKSQLSPILGEFPLHP